MVAARDAEAGGEGGHAWSTFFAFKQARGGWTEIGHAAGPVTSASGRWQIGVSARVDRDGPFFTVTTSSSSPEEGERSAIHLWSWDGKEFQQVLTATTARQGATETEASFVLCADRPDDHPSWELRSREREGRGKWTETRGRVLWNGQAWVERPADKPCSERASPVAVAMAASTLQVKSASASRSAAPPRGQPQANAPGQRHRRRPPDRLGARRQEGRRRRVAAARLHLGGLGRVAEAGDQLPRAPTGRPARASRRSSSRFEDGPAQEESLADVQAPQSIILKRKEPARWIRIELLELYKGSRKQDACITEATPQGR